MITPLELRRAREGLRMAPIINPIECSVALLKLRELVALKDAGGALALDENGCGIPWESPLAVAFSWEGALYALAFKAQLSVSYWRLLEYLRRAITPSVYAPNKTYHLRIVELIERAAVLALADEQTIERAAVLALADPPRLRRRS
jgi:hypothetical protein